ncbi:hypothetical protein MMC30_007427 [Trapelia coarctata]|nr:hypothetical protein [Trapelia coarctata]
MTDLPPPLPPPPSSILIVGAGVFGLSTALALLSSARYSETRITILDSRTPTPRSGAEVRNPPTASIDSSRIVRADYAIPAYASLAASAQTLWRQNWGGPGVYHENGLCFTSHRNGGGGEGYVRSSLENVRALNNTTDASTDIIEYLPTAAEIKRVMKGAGGGSGDWGYVNWRSGWVDAEAAVEEARRKIQALAATHSGGVEWIYGNASRLLHSASPSPSSPSAQPTQRTITGVLLAPPPSPSPSPSRPLHASLTILATGAYTPLLLPHSLSPRLTATGQVIAYLQLTPAERAQLGSIPVLLNESTGMFIIPPPPSGLLKIARHGFGYRNPTRARIPDCEHHAGRTTRADISVPSADYTTLPPEAHRALHAAVEEMIPWLPSRAFAATRMCWYADTPTGDFLVDYHPSYGRSLLVATGGSGHGFKFLPVLGAKVVERVEGRLGGELARLWAWGTGRGGEWWCEEGSRGGGRGMRYEEEMGRRGAKL